MKTPLIIILTTSLYWFLSYLFLDYVLEKNKKILTFKLKYNKLFYKISKLSKIYKNILPSISRFDKRKIKSKNKEYIKDYCLELNKAFLIHSLIFLFLIPIFLINNNLYIIINLIFLIIINIPFILIVYYNKIRLQNIVKTKRGKYE